MSVTREAPPGVALAEEVPISGMAITRVAASANLGKVQARLLDVKQMLAALPVVLVISGCTGAGGGSHPARTTMPPVPAAATLTGRLLASGLAVRPIPGTVSGRGPQTFRVKVGRDGRFSVTMFPGRYLLTGRSPLYNGGAGVCRHVGLVDVPAQATTHADVVCVER